MQSLRWLLVFVITMMLVDTWTQKVEANPSATAPGAAADQAPHS